MKNVTVLSLFDGMACGHIAMQTAGLNVARYDAYEIDKYAMKVASHNFPDIEQKGDVFKADFTQYEGVDFVIGGSPCTYWSIAQKNNRETEASGLGWELFSQYVRAIKEAKPRFFIYENNKSMSKQIRASINETFGFEAIGINSALVSAQNRQRLYWVGKREADGTYSKVPVEMPEDRGILLRDILEGRSNEKTYRMAATPVRIGTMPQLNGILKDNQASRIYSVDGKATTQSAQGGGWGAKTGLYAVPYECESLSEEYFKGAISGNLIGMIENSSVYRNGNQPSQQYRVYSCEGKVVCVDHGQKKHYIIPTKTSDTSDGKPVYEVRDGKITIKGKQYPIKLIDGYYIIRKLTVRECMRLQTVPEWYDFSVISNSQAYKCLGNGWTVEVIAHLIKSVMATDKE